MSSGAILTAIFDILWLGSILVLSVSSVWLIFSIVRILRRLESHLIAATEDSTHAMTQLAQAVSASKLPKPPKPKINQPQPAASPPPQPSGTSRRRTPSPS